SVLPKGLDPDEFVRKYGRDRLDHLVKSAVEILRYAIADELDGENFRRASLNEKLERVRAVAEVLRKEHDPNLRAMVKMFADDVSRRLVLNNRAPENLNDLERLIGAALSAGAKPVVLPPSQVAVTHDRARSRAQYDEISFEILGAVLDFPELLYEPET